jgi:hypothetical protein
VPEADLGSLGADTIKLNFIRRGSHRVGKNSVKDDHPSLAGQVHHSCVRDSGLILGGLEFSAAGISYFKVSSMEASMRILSIAAVLALLLSSAAVAQSDSPKGYNGAYGPDAPNRAFGGPVSEVYPGPSLDEVEPDGISTKVVKAVPCSTAARETDGTTTCIGIPGPIRSDSLEGTTTGMSRR